MQHGAQRIDRALRCDAVEINTRSVLVGNSSSTDRNTVIGSTLRVHVYVREVAEHFTTAPPEFVPNLRRQWFGRDHRRIHREPQSVMTTELRGESLGGADDVLGRDRPVRRAHAMRFDLNNARALEDVHAEALTGIRKPGDELRWLNTRAVRMPHRRAGIRNIDPAPRLGLLEQLHIGIPPLPLCSSECPQTGLLSRTAGDVELAAFHDVSIDLFVSRNADHFVDRFIHHSLKALDRLSSVGLHILLTSAGNLMGEPATVPPRGTISDMALFDDRDACVGPGLFEVVRGPEPGEPRTNNRHINRHAAGKFRSRCGLPELLPPVRNVSIDHDRALSHSDCTRPSPDHGQLVSAASATVCSDVPSSRCGCGMEGANVTVEGVHRTLLETVRRWIAQDPDTATRDEATTLLERTERGDAEAQAELTDAFDGRLAFGTAGLRGRLGAGPRRMNRVVVMQTSAGFAQFLLDRAERGEAATPPSVVIGFDGRENSDVFARDTAAVLAGAGVRAILFPEALPTPVTAFAVRHLNASAGVMITASHNPPRDNGYKVFLGDADEGVQIIPPDDLEIARLIAQAADLPLEAIPLGDDIAVASPEVHSAYIAETVRSVRGPLPPRTAPPGENELRIAYTAMHGVGSATAHQVFELAGLPSVTPVVEQDQPNGVFPTVSFPNPEEPGALDLAFATAKRIDADLVVAHDPDADRLALAFPRADDDAGYRRLTGNELGLLLGWRAAERHRRLHGDTPGTLACTIVSSPALRAVADAYGLDYAETLSGFKWVARVPRLIFGFEEALGYLVNPDIVRDKDGISASADAIAMVRELAEQGRTVWDLLAEAGERFGHFASSQITVRLGSMAAAVALAETIRTTPPNRFGDVDVARSTDLSEPGHSEVPANVLRYDLVDASRVMIRPSGTEPKLKLYLDTFSENGDAAMRREDAEHRLVRLETAVRTFLDDAQHETGQEARA